MVTVFRTNWTIETTTVNGQLSMRCISRGGIIDGIKDGVELWYQSGKDEHSGSQGVGQTRGTVTLWDPSFKASFNTRLRKYPRIFRTLH